MPAKGYTDGRWIAGVVIDCLERSYYVQVGDQVWKRHEDQLRLRSQEYVLEPDLPVIPVPSVPAVAPPETPVVNSELTAEVRRGSDSQTIAVPVKTLKSVP